ncbi:ADP-ribosyltransferase [Microbacterium phage Zooman]|nr:ADP-ribosyltransferase [Microbacterium phage Zooman]
MTKLIHREGDIFTTEARGIGHGVNLMGQMGAGIAAQFSARLPAMYEEYKDICARGALAPGDVHVWDFPVEAGQPSRHIFNISSQVAPGANAHYSLILKGVGRALRRADALGIGTLALPRIGGKIGGLEDTKVEGILHALAELYETDIELWTYPG